MNWKVYTQKRGGKQIEARPWIEGEDMSGIKVGEGAMMRVGSMVCREIDNHAEQWYMYEGLFRYNYGEP